VSTESIANYDNQGYSWTELDFPHEQAVKIHLRLADVLTSWEDTPYLAGEQAKGHGTDCIRFVCGALDELAGVSNIIPREMQDVSMHDHRKAIKIMRMIQNLYPDYIELPRRVQELQPGDVIVTGQASGGPGHAILVGSQRNTIWQATKKGVKKGGFGFMSYFQQVMAVYRPNKLQWIS